MTIKSSLARFMPDSINCFKLKRDAWIDEKILVVSPEQRNRLSKLDNELLDNIGTYLYEHNR